MKKYVIILTILCFFTIILHFVFANQNYDNKGEKYVYNKGEKFSLDIPDNWSANDKNKNLLLTLTGPKDGARNITININKEETSFPKLKEYLESAFLLIYTDINNQTIEAFGKELPGDKLEVIKSLIEKKLRKNELKTILTKANFNDKEIELTIDKVFPKSSSVKQIDILSEENVIINNNEAYQATIDYTFDFQGNKYSTRVLETIMLYKGSAYIITGSATKDNFDKYRDTFKEVTNSFKFE
jgi:hypothetical protein